MIITNGKNTKFVQENGKTKVKRRRKMKKKIERKRKKRV